MGNYKAVNALWSRGLGDSFHFYLGLMTEIITKAERYNQFEYYFNFHYLKVQGLNEI